MTSRYVYDKRTLPTLLQMEIALPTVKFRHVVVPHVLYSEENQIYSPSPTVTSRRATGQMTWNLHTVKKDDSSNVLS